VTVRTNRSFPGTIFESYLRFKSGIWAATGIEDYLVATATTDEPILQNMLGLDAGGTAPYLGKTVISALELFQIQTRRKVLRKEYLDHWESTVAITSTGRTIDAIISPAAAHPPMPHGQHR